MLLVEGYNLSTTICFVKSYEGERVVQPIIKVKEKGKKNKHQQ